MLLYETSRIVQRQIRNCVIKVKMTNLNQRDIIKASDTTKRLVNDEYYYKYIFKKTERIVSVVFYVLYNTPVDSKTSMYVEDIQTVAKNVHDAVLSSLETRMYVAEDAVRTTALTLIALESKMRVAYTAHVIASDILQMLVAEIDSVLRAMNKYINTDKGFDSSMVRDAFDQESSDTQRHKRTLPSTVPKHDTTAVHDKDERRTRILTVLQAKGTASIKDIAEVIHDCSEKTIQRELNAMIEDNKVKRQGERRWSTYSVA